MSTNEIIENVLELPLEQRVIVADLLTQSLNTPNNEVQKNWEKEVKKRLELLEQGKIETIDSNEFFNDN
jgi:hypothetical protein